jgi:hypothetical protein
MKGHRCGAIILPINTSGVTRETYGCTVATGFHLVLSYRSMRGTVNTQRDTCLGYKNALLPDCITAT